MKLNVKMRNARSPFSFALAQSITNEMSSMVMLVSAMFVASTLFRAPCLAGWKTCDCWFIGMPECSWRTENFERFEKGAVVSRTVDKYDISCHPGKKTSTECVGVVDDATCVRRDSIKSKSISLASSNVE